MVFSNIIKKDELRKVQLKSLKEISDALICSFGPMGSNTLILTDGMQNKYSKDGYSILKQIKLSGSVEYSIVEDLVNITKGIVSEFGDNTTSAILMAYLLFKEMTKMETENSELPFVIIDRFKKAVKVVSDVIEKNGRPCTLEDIYNIAYTSTNGNEKIARELQDIYKRFGMDVFIDVSASPNGADISKDYDGLTLDTGYSDTAYINNKTKGVCYLRNPQIYVFDDPIDTPEMMALFDSIISQNIMLPYHNGRMEDVVPTVIMATFISRDLSATIESTINFMYNTPEGNRPPLLILSNIHQQEQYKDIARMCDAKLICKYIDSKQQQRDIEAGLAPTPSSVVTFGGSAEVVEASVSKTKFINPIGMKTPEGEFTSKYSSLVEWIESNIKSAEEEGRDANYIGNLKRRLNSLKCNMVEFFIGGVSSSDRDSLRDLVEDAVLNCRSAAANGVGYGANFEGYRASMTALSDISTTSELVPYIKVLMEAYYDVSVILYSTVMSKENAEDALKDSIEKGKPLNIRTKEFDGTVLTSIKSDIITLDTLSKILTLMITSNQALVQDPMRNNYYSEERTQKALAMDNDFTIMD